MQLPPNKTIAPDTPTELRPAQAGRADQPVFPGSEGASRSLDLIAHDVIFASALGGDHAPDQLAQIAPHDAPAAAPDGAGDPFASQPVLVAALPNDVSHAPTQSSADWSTTTSNLPSNGASDLAIGHISVSAFPSGASWSGGFAGLPAPSMDHALYTNFISPPSATSVQPSSVHYADHNLVPAPVAVTPAPHTVETHAAPAAAVEAHPAPSQATPPSPLTMLRAIRLRL